MTKSSKHEKFISLSSGVFYTVIDMQLHELKSRFENSELLLCVAC